MTDGAIQLPAECFCVCCEEAKRGCHQQQHFNRKSDCVKHFLAEQQRRRENGCTLPTPEIFSTGTRASTKLLEHIEHTLALIARRAEEEPPNFSDD